MSYNSDFNKNKCWSCEHFCGNRKLKTGIFFGDSVENDDWGTCCNSRSNNYNKKVRENDWCSKYNKWGVLQSLIAKKENEQTLEQIKHQQREEQQKLETERRHAEDERRATELEIARLEHERWYASLSDEEKQAYDEQQRQKKLKEQEWMHQWNIEHENLKKQQAAEKEQQEKIRKKNLIGIILSIVLLIIFIAIVINICK